MITTVTIGNKPYSFKFGMRMLWQVSGKHDLEFEEIYTEMQKNYDLCLDIFVEANKLAVKKEGGNAITVDELEDALDKDAFQGNGKILKKLFSAFSSPGENGQKKRKVKS